MSAVEAQAIAAWTSASLSLATVPAAFVAAWLLELGGPVGLLLPESPGQDMARECFAERERESERERAKKRESITGWPVL